MRVYVEGTGQWHLPAALEHWELAGRAGLVCGPKSRRGRDDSCACPSGKALSPGKKGIFPKASRKACLKKLFLTKKNKYLTTLSSLDFRLFFCYFSLSGKILLHGLSGNVFIAVDSLSSEGNLQIRRGILDRQHVLSGCSLSRSVGLLATELPLPLMHCTTPFFRIALPFHQGDSRQQEAFTQRLRP